MRKVTEDITQAFMERKPRTIGNSSTDGTTLFLHGNAIARHTSENIAELEISMAGWSSNTTRERLNGLPWVRLYQRKGVQYLNGYELDTRAWVKPLGYGAELAAAGVPAMA
jgi:hypothetical protein